MHGVFDLYGWNKFGLREPGVAHSGLRRWQLAVKKFFSRRLSREASD
jgi:hypothetical protein